MKNIKTIFKKIKNNIHKKTEEFSSINSIRQLYQSSLLHLPKYVIDCSNHSSIDLEAMNKSIERSNTVMGLTNIIIQISLRRNDKKFTEFNNNLLNIFPDIARNFNAVMSNDKQELYISGSVLDYINFFKYTRDYGNPFVKAILKEINENTYKEPFKELIEDGFMNEKKFLASYDYDEELQTVNYSSLDIVYEDSVEAIKGYFLHNHLDDYEIGKLCFITLKLKEDFIEEDGPLYGWLLRLSKSCYFGPTFTMIHINYIDLYQYLTSDRVQQFLELDKKQRSRDLVKLYDHIKELSIFSDENLLTPRYKLEQIQPEDPDEIIDESEEVQEKNKSEKIVTKNKRVYSKEQIEQSMENYINNIDDPEKAMTKINLDNFYDEDEEYDPENYI